MTIKNSNSVDLQTLPDFLSVIDGLELSSENIFQLIKGKTFYNLQRELATKLVNEREQSIIWDSFEHFIGMNDENFASSLKPLENADNNFVSFATSGKSLFKLLAGIPTMQTRVLEITLDRFSIYASSDPSPSFEGDYQLTKLFLNQLKWSEGLTETTLLASKIVDILPICPLSLQREIISSIPEIVADKDQTAVATELISLMEAESDLLAVTLDSLSSLNLEQSTLDGIRSSFLERLHSAESRDLPIILRFLFQTTSIAPEIKSLVTEIREKITLSSLISLNEKNDLLLVTDSIKFGLKFNRIFAEEWLKLLSTINKETDFQDMDIYVLFELHQTTNSLKKKVETLIKTKIEKEIVTNDFFEATFSKYTVLIKSLFVPILKTAEYLLASSPSKGNIGSCSKLFYHSLFKIGSPFQKQDVIMTLITHIGSGCTPEITAALAIMKDILQNSRDISLDRFGPFVKGILDYIDDFTCQQVRDFYDILCTVALQNTENTTFGALAEEILILLRKQLSHPADKYKKMGIIGLCCFLSRLSKNENNMEMCGSLLKLAAKCVKESIVCTNDFYDELSSVISKSNEMCTDFVQLVAENIAYSFQPEFVGEKNEYEKKDSCPEKSLQYRVEYELRNEPGEFVMKILPAAFETNSSPFLAPGYSLQKSKIHTLPHLFNLLQSCEIALDGNLDNIDALLGCGLVLFENNSNAVDADLLENQRYMICAVFQSINWCKELVNAFVSQENKEYAMKCSRRLETILELEERLESLLANIELSKLADIFPIEGINKLIMRYLRPEKSTVTVTDEMESFIGEFREQDDLSEDKSVKDTGKGKLKTVSISANDLRPWMREFNPNIIDLLQLRDNNHELMLKGKPLIMLLKDILQKSENKFSPAYDNPLSATRRRKDQLCNEDSMFARLPAISYLQIVSKSMQSLKLIVDHAAEACSKLESSEDIEHDELLCQSFQLTIRIIDTILSGKDKSNACLATKFSEVLRPFVTNKGFTQICDGLLLDCTDFFCKIANLWPLGVEHFYLVRIIVKFASLAKDPERIHTKLSALLDRFLVSEWPDKPRIKDEMHLWVLSQMVMTSKSSVVIIREYIGELIPGAMCRDIDVSKKNVFLNKGNVLSVFKVIFNELSESLKRFSLGKEHDLNILVKNEDGKIFLAVVLKYGKHYVETFTKYCVPILDSNLTLNKGDVNRCIKFMQQGTRIMQSICGHSKEYKEVQIVSVVPAVRKSLEAFVFSIKSVLSKHSALSAFWIGNLKHRSLNGEVLSSQLPVELSQIMQDEKIVLKRKKKSQGPSKEKKKTKEATDENGLSESIIVDSDKEDDDEEDSNNGEDEEKGPNLSALEAICEEADEDSE